MDVSKKSSPTKSTDSLTESWNVVEPQDVNNAYEGSDGESIEVIDEEAQQAGENSQPNEDSEQKSESSDCSKSDEEEIESNFENDSPEDYSSNDSIFILDSSKHDDCGLFSITNTCGILAFFMAVLFTGATVSILILKVEEVALDTLNYFSSSMTIHSDREYRQLLNQIEKYKEESQDLKNMVSDLNEALFTVKKELVNQRNMANKERSQGAKSANILSVEDSLFQQLLDVHTGNYQDGNNSNQETDLPFENSFKIIEDMLLTLTAGKEKEDIVETLKLFYNIPKHLSVLNNFDPSNPNILSFIEIWQEKLSTVNEKLVEDMKEMQLKMIRHIVKHLRKTQKAFFKKMCYLENIKHSKCYEAFIKPYESVDDMTGDIEEEHLDIIVSDSDKRNVIPNNNNKNNGNQACGSKPSHGKQKIKTRVVQKSKAKDSDNKDKFQKYVELKNSNNIIGKVVKRKTLKETGVTESDDSTNDHNYTSEKKSSSQNNKMHNVPQVGSSVKTSDQTIQKNKGMDSDLIKNQNKDATNSFSSFSEDKYGQEQRRQQKGLEWKKEQRIQEYLMRLEGSWFLRLGKHRSRLRYFESRGDWLFERARFRRRRNFP